MIIDNGTFAIDTADDAIHADETVEVNAGTIDVTSSYEGIEGTISIDAYGDGIDSNGYVVMTGGTVTIDGSTSSRDGALDHNGTFEMIGGTIVGTHIDGMTSEGINTGSQASTFVTTDGTISGGTVIHIETADGEGVLTYETVNDFSAIVFSSSDLVAGESYSIDFDGTAEGDSVNGMYAADAYTAGTLAGTVTAG